VPATLDFSFSVEFEDLPTADDRPNNFLRAVITLLLFVVSLTISVVFVFTNRANPTWIVPYREVWRLPNSFPNLLLFAGSGLLFIAVGIAISLICPGQYAMSSFIGKTAALVMVAPVQLMALIATTLSIRLDDRTLIGPALLYYACVCGPLNFFTVLFGFFGAFRGYRIRHLVLSEPILLLLIAEIARGFGNSARYFRVLYVIEAHTGPSNFPLRPIGFLMSVFDVVCIIASVIVIAPICDHLIEVLCDDALIDIGLCMAVVFEYGAAAALAGLLRTVYRLGRLTVHWAEHHVTVHTSVAIGVAAYVAVRAVMRFSLPEFQVIAAFAVAGWGIAGASMTIGAFFSYVWSFVTVLFAFAQEKTS
jgi:hypothetical protein